MGIYMKYGNIQGDATQQGFDGYININSFDWKLHRHFAEDQVGRSFNREASQAHIDRCTVTKEVDHSSGELLQAAATGFKGQPCEIVFLRTGNPGERYLTFKLTDTLISSLSVSGEGEERPSETIVLDFTELEIVCKTLDESNVSEDEMHITYNAATGIGG
jgi:type VI secretion system secreted protein Hcp